MRSIIYKISNLLRNRKAQILLPSVMLAPIFILVMYLLFELAKVSIAKVRNQYALDNAAYTQVTAVSTYLNALAMVNGPLPYRVMRTYDAKIKMKKGVEDIAKEALGKDAKESITIFDLFFRAGAVPTIADDYEWGVNNPPKPESTDWGVHFAYYEGIDKGAVQEEGSEKGYKYDRRAMGWESPQPKHPTDKDEIALMQKELVRYYDVDVDKVTVPAILGYLSTYAQVGSIYESQTYSFKETTRNAQAFREGYYLNVDDCKRASCARQSARQLTPYLKISSKRFDVDKALFFSTRGGTGATEIPLTMKEMIGTDLFLFSYLDGSSMSVLRSYQRGVKLKQSYHLPSNYFNVHLEQKYKPYVRNSVLMTCGRGNNNCVWPNPLPKYNVYLRP